MATNVFGNPVTNDTVRRVYPNLTTITARHRADVAVLFMHDENRMGNLSRFVYNLVPRHSSDAAATFGMIYNATGNTLTFSMRRTWGGDVFQVFYPAVIQNGQWAGFLHLDANFIHEISKEAIVYRGQDENGNARHWVLGWSTHFLGLPHPNHVYTRVERDQPSPGASTYWNGIDRSMRNVRNNFHSSSLHGCFSSVTLGAESRAEFVAIMSLAGVTANVRAMGAEVSTIPPSLVDESDAAEYEDDGGESDAAASAAAQNN